MITLKRLNRDRTNLSTDAIRAALSARNRKMNLSTLERDLGLPTNVLDAFIGGNSNAATVSTAAP